MARTLTADEALAHVDARLADAVARLRGGVGFVGADVPADVLLASGRAFGHLPWRARGATPWADRWLESSFPYWTRSILEQWHDGAFDELEAVVFSRAEDASQRLFYYVRELRRRGLLGGPMPRVFDVALLPRESSVAHTTNAVVELTRALGIDAGGLAAGIDRANALRHTLAAIARARAAYGPLYERLARAALWSDASAWLGELALPVPTRAAVRVLLAGSVPPDDRVHIAVERAGACVVAETHVHGLRRLGNELVVSGEPAARAIARHVMATSVSPRAVFARGPWLVAQAADARAAGVVLWLTREDESLGWHVPAVRRALAAAGVPALVLAASRWQADDGVLDSIAAFCGGLPHAAA